MANFGIFTLHNSKNNETTKNHHLLPNTSEIQVAGNEKKKVLYVMCNIQLNLFNGVAYRFLHIVVGDTTLPRNFDILEIFIF